MNNDQLIKQIKSFFEKENQEENNQKFENLESANNNLKNNLNDFSKRINTTEKDINILKQDTEELKMFTMSESVRVEHGISLTRSEPLGLCSLCVFAAGRQSPRSVRWPLPRASTQREQRRGGTERQ